MPKLTLKERRELGEEGKAGTFITTPAHKYKCTRGVAKHWVDQANNFPAGGQELFDPPTVTPLLP
jgi:hypothetical protein